MVRVVTVWLAGVIALILACETSLAADVAACRRVLPEGGFVRELILPDGSVSRQARLGPNGERGLFLAGSTFDEDSLSWRYWLRRLGADPGGGASVTDDTTVEGPGGYAGFRGLLATDVDDDGLEDAVIVWGSGSRNSPIAVDLHLRREGSGFESARRLELGTGLVREVPRLADFDGDGRREVALIAPACTGCPEDLHIVELDAADGPRIGSSVSGAHVAPFGTIALDVDHDRIDDLLLLSDTSVTVRFGAEDAPLTVRVDRPLPFRALNFGKRDGRLVALEGRIVWVGWRPRHHYETVHELGKDLELLWSQPLPPDGGKLRPSLDVDGDGHQELQHGFLFDNGFFGRSIVGSRLLWGSASGPSGEGTTLATQRYLVAVMHSAEGGGRMLVTSDHAVVPLSDPEELHDGAIPTLFAEAPFWDQPYAWTVAGDLNEDGLDDVVAQTFFVHRGAVGLAVGDGTFELEPFGVPAIEMLYPEIVDHDGDGHLDLSPRRRALQVAWGRGDGTFEWPAEGAPYERVSRAFWDLDRDGDDDAVEWRFGPYSQSATLHTILFDGRNFTRSEPLWEVGYDWHWTLVGADIDGDGIKDLLMATQLAGQPSTDRLYWLRSKGDGRFEPAVPLVHEQLPETRGLRLFGADFDLDGRDDLLLHTSSSFPARGEYIALRNEGNGRLATVWRTPARTVGRHPLEQVTDVDGDGRPDLVAGYADPWALPSYESAIWWGDGFGGFEPSNETGWGVSPGAVGRFRKRGGLDIARIRQFNHHIANIELFVGRGRVKDRDEAPPEVEIRLFPFVDTSMVPARFDGAWRIAAVPIDDCDDAPNVLQRVIELLPLPPDTLVSFRRAADAVVEVYELPGERPVREVQLRGPDESEMYELLAAGRECGGFGFEHWGAPVKLASSPSYAPGAGQLPSPARRVQRFEFVREQEGRLRLAAASQTHPAHPLMIAAQAEDAAGRRGVTRTSLPEARARAIENLCRQAADGLPEAPVVCSEPARR